MAQTTFDISGMHCASCVGRVERALLAMPGVVTAHVNLALDEAVVEGLPDSAAEARIASGITQAGYPARIKVAGAGRAEKTAQKQAEIATLGRMTLIAAMLTLPVFLVEMGGHALPSIHHWIAGTIGQANSWLIQAVLITVVMVWPGRDFYLRGLPALFKGAPDMNALVAIGTLAAWGYSMVALFAPAVLPIGTAAVYFEAAGVIVTLILLGRYLEARAKGRTGEAIAKLVGLRPTTATARRGAAWVQIAADQIVIGDELQVAPGETIPADGTVIEGQSYVNESMMTGEPVPVQKGTDARIIGGTLNTTGSLILRVSHVGEASVLAQIIRMVEDAQGARLPVQELVNRITLWFVPVVMALALLTVLGWLVFGPDPALRFALVAGVSVLIVACPCAMGLATPTSIMVGTGRAAQMGVLFRKGDALQSLQSVRTIVFDKTGTLTMGHPDVTDLSYVDGADAAKVFADVAAVEARSEHPIAKAIVAYATARDLTIPKAQEFEAVIGYGAKASVDGRLVLVGTARFMAENDVPIAALKADSDAWTAQGKTLVFAATDGKIQALLAVSDALKPTTTQALNALHGMGIKLAMITGDTQASANAIAAELPLDHVLAEALPDQKLAALKQMQGPVAFVGDGINDAPALAAADVGIAVGTGTDIAIEAADVVLMSGDLLAVVNAVQISKHTMRNIRQNLFWAFAYNSLLIPVAAGVFYPLFGVLLSPALAAGAMALSSVFVLSNALRLRWVQPATQKQEA
jgi:Cu+-exporting ATPase